MDNADRAAKALFQEIVDLAPEERAAYLDAHCDDAALRAAVEELLRHHDTATWLLEHPPAPVGLEAMVPEAHARLDDFEVRREIGRGGMAIVYLAWEKGVEREVALKVLPPNATASEQRVARFRHEARAIAQLKHPAIVPIHRVGEDGGVHYIAMEYVEGTTLAAIVRERRQLTGRERARAIAPPALRAEALRLAMIAEALDHAHQRGIIHRDVKPSNILVDREGRLRLTDFGIAKIVADEAITMTGEVTGTVLYMSPEQAAAQRTSIDRRSDVFSLGVVLYELFTLELPFRGETSQEVLNQVLTHDPRRARLVNPSISRDLETIVHKALEKSPAHRYRSAGHLAADLRCYAAGEPILARPPSLARRGRVWLRRHRSQVSAGAIVLLLLLAAWMARLEIGRRRAALCPVSIAEPAGAAVRVQRFDDVTLEPGPAEVLGVVPLEGVRLRPGLYRFTIVGPGGDFAELTEHLDAPARERRLEARILPAAQVEAGMIAFAAGDHRHGWIQGGEDLQRERTVRLPAFLLDAAEVSNAEYRAFVQATGHPEPAHWQEQGYDPALDDRPVVGVTQRDAQLYARWRGKRLPTVFEWEGAARADGDAAVPPRGAVPAEDALTSGTIHDRDRLYELYRRWTRPVRDPAHRAPSGLHHMPGNVREWSANVRPDRNGAAMFKGNAWSDPPEAEITASRMMPGGAHSFRIGFRCARSAAPVSPPPDE